MSYNSKQYLAYEERLLEPGIIVTGTQRRYKETSMSAKNRFYNQLTDAEREQLAKEYEYGQQKKQFQQ
jgi:hypothetical protein